MIRARLLVVVVGWCNEQLFACTPADCANGKATFGAVQKPGTIKFMWVGNGQGDTHFNYFYWQRSLF